MSRGSPWSQARCQAVGQAFLADPLLRQLDVVGHAPQFNDVVDHIVDDVRGPRVTVPWLPNTARIHEILTANRDAQPRVETAPDRICLLKGHRYVRVAIETNGGHLIIEVCLGFKLVKNIGPRRGGV